MGMGEMFAAIGIKIHNWNHGRRNPYSSDFLHFPYHNIFIGVVELGFSVPAHDLGVWKSKVVAVRNGNGYN